MQSIDLQQACKPMDGPTMAAVVFPFFPSIVLNFTHIFQGPPWSMENIHIFQGHAEREHSQHFNLRFC
jgi:hypothetical protein